MIGLLMLAAATSANTPVYLTCDGDLRITLNEAEQKASVGPQNISNVSFEPDTVKLLISSTRYSAAYIDVDRVTLRWTSYLVVSNDPSVPHRPIGSGQCVMDSAPVNRKF